MGSLTALNTTSSVASAPHSARSLKVAQIFEDLVREGMVEWGNIVLVSGLHSSQEDCREIKQTGQVCGSMPVSHVDGSSST